MRRHYRLLDQQKIMGGVWDCAECFYGYDYLCSGLIKSINVNNANHRISTDGGEHTIGCAVQLTRS